MVKMQRNWNPCAVLVGMKNHATTAAKFSSSSKLDIALPCDPAILVLGIHPKELRTGTQPTFTTASITTAKRREEHECLPTDEWINKMLYTRTKEYYPALKRNKNSDRCHTVDEPLEHSSKPHDKYVTPLT